MISPEEAIARTAASLDDQVAAAVLEAADALMRNGVIGDELICEVEHYEAVLVQQRDNAFEEIRRWILYGDESLH